MYYVAYPMARFTILHTVVIEPKKVTDTGTERGFSMRLWRQFQTAYAYQVTLDNSQDT